MSVVRPKLRAGQVMILVVLYLVGVAASLTCLGLTLVMFATDPCASSTPCGAVRQTEVVVALGAFIGAPLLIAPLTFRLRPYRAKLSAVVFLDLAPLLALLVFLVWRGR